MTDVVGPLCSHDPARFGATVRQLRLARGLTLQKLADEVGCVKGYLSLVERGLRPPPLEPLALRLEAALHAPARLLARAAAWSRTPALIRAEGIGGASIPLVVLDRDAGQHFHDDLQLRACHAPHASFFTAYTIPGAPGVVPVLAVVIAVASLAPGHKAHDIVLLGEPSAHATRTHGLHFSSGLLLGLAPAGTVCRPSLTLIRSLGRTRE
jgi:transcriptional regulator with XRE-family HTH domain